MDLISKWFLFSILVVLSSCESCYWNANGGFNLFSTKTPYDSVRGDIRDARDISGCTPISVWSINRHGNRNPGSDVTSDMKRITNLIKSDIIASFEDGTSRLCAQDIEDLKKWAWNKTIEVSSSYLTGVGYEELFDMGKRIREKFPHLVDTGDNNKFYFRTTNEQRTITSSIAYVNGLTEGTDLKISVDGPYAQDEVIRPYEICPRYQEEVKKNPIIEKQMEGYLGSSEFLTVRDRVQQRIGIPYQLTSKDVYALYETCRFYRSWTQNLKSPWCAVFGENDLVVLEYMDDLRHYYRNGYGSWVNGKLGEQAAKDLYNNFEEAIKGEGKNIIAYFTHDTMMEMFFCALELFKDDAPITSEFRNNNRLWKTSNTAVFATNFVAVLSRCNDTEDSNYNVQFFINEKPLPICFNNICNLEQFREKFQKFSDANLEFCNLDENRNEMIKTFKIVAY